MNRLADARGGGKQSPVGRTKCENGAVARRYRANSHQELMKLNKCSMQSGVSFAVKREFARKIENLFASHRETFAGMNSSINWQPVLEWNLAKK